MLYALVSTYAHVETVSSPNHTFFWASLTKRWKGENGHINDWSISTKVWDRAGIYLICSHTRYRLRFAARWVILNGIFTIQYQDGLLVNIGGGGGGVTDYNFQTFSFNSIDKQYCRLMLHFIWVFTFCQSTRLGVGSHRVNSAGLYTLGNKLSITLANAAVNLRLKLPYILEMFHQTSFK